MATFRNGKTIKYTKRQIVKSYTGRTYKTTSAIERQYRRIYNRTYAKLRKYEKLTGRDKQSTRKYLLAHARWKGSLRTQGLKYKPRETTKYIESLDLRKATKQTQKYVSKQFNALIKRDSRAKELFNKFKNNPKVLVRAMTDYADIRRKRYNDLKIDPLGKVTEKDKGGIYSEEISGEALREVLELYDEQ